MVARRSRRSCGAAPAGTSPRGGRPEVEGHEGGGAVEQLVPARVPLRGKPVALGVVVVGAQVVVVVEVPAGELAGRDAAGDRVGEAEDAFHPGSAGEDRAVDDLVQQGRHVEEGEALEDGEGDPEERVGRRARGPGRRGRRSRTGGPHRGGAGRAADVQRPELRSGDRRLKLALERGDLLPVVVGFDCVHLSILTATPAGPQGPGCLPSERSSMSFDR